MTVMIKGPPMICISMFGGLSWELTKEQIEKDLSSERCDVVSGLRRVRSDCEMQRATK